MKVKTNHFQFSSLRRVKFSHLSFLCFRLVILQAVLSSLPLAERKSNTQPYVFWLPLQKVIKIKTWHLLSKKYYGAIFLLLSDEGNSLWRPSWNISL